MTQTVGKVYAEALFLLAQEERSEQQIYEELNAAADLLEQYPDFLMLLSVPTLNLEERLAILRNVIGDGQGTMEHFLALLVEKHRISHIAAIRKAFNQLYFDASGIAEVFVTTAVPMEEAQKAALIAAMQKKLKRDVTLKETVDAAILGGMIVQYGDTRMDNSLRSRMQELSQTMEQNS